MKLQYSELAQEYSGKNEGYYNLDRGEMLRFVPNDARSVLDIGCSSGGFGKMIKENRPEVAVFGIEPSEEAAAIARGRLDGVICGIFQDGMVELEGQKFDCIVFNDVLEHLIKPENALVDAKNYLSETGIVVASIPNILHFYQITKILLEQDWKYEDSGILDNTHLRFFTKKSIVRMFEACGYRVLKIDGINPSFGMKYKVANAVALGRLVDWKFEQFAVQAITSKT